MTHLQHWVGLQQSIFDSLHLLAGRTGDGIVLQDLLGRLRLPGAALAGDEDALVLPLRPQGSVRVVCHGVAAVTSQTDMIGVFVSLLLFKL